MELNSIPIESEQDSSVVVDISYIECVGALSKHFAKKVCYRSLDCFADRKSALTIEKDLKHHISNAVFDRKLKYKHKSQSFLWQLLSDGWSGSLVTECYCLKLCLEKRRILEAERVRTLVDSLPKNDLWQKALHVLLCLAESEPASTDAVLDKTLVVPSKTQRVWFEDNMKENIYGDLNFSVSTLSYQLYPQTIFSLEYSDPQRSLGSGDSSERFEDFTKSFSSTSSSGIGSTFFDSTGDIDDAFSKKSKETLFGGLTHTRTQSLNVSLSLPSIPVGKSLDLLERLNDESTHDDGFVSGTSSLNQSFNDISTNMTSTRLCFDDNQPYHGYRSPSYDVSIWSKSLSLLKIKHRTWERIGLPPAEEVKKRYATECSPQVYDEMWKERRRLEINMNEFYGRTKPQQNSLDNWQEVKESVLVNHASLACVGIKSESFDFDKFSSMFLPNPSIYLTGTTTATTISALKRFAEWGTCFWRLLEMAATNEIDELSFTLESPERGVIFKALCGGIMHYLNDYRRVVADNAIKCTTITQLATKLKPLGYKIKYVAALCKLTAPDKPAVVHSTPTDILPSGVELLDYLYDEAICCTDDTYYYLLLYLLRICSLPYLQFVQAWVFRGECHQMKGEFMFRINSEVHRSRDRRRWTHYVQMSSQDGAGVCQYRVPVFLQSFADEIFMCGKTVELLQMICPQHFLCTHSMKIPAITINFTEDGSSRSRRDWTAYEKSLLTMESNRTLSWQQKELDDKEARQQKVELTHRRYDEELRLEREEREEILRQIHEAKHMEYNRLRQQADEAVQRKTEERRKEKEADKAFALTTDSLFSIDNLQNQKSAHFMKAKEKLLEEYDELNEQARQREEIANWKMRRLALDERREAFLKNLYESERQQFVGQSKLPSGGATEETADNETSLVPLVRVEAGDLGLSSNLNTKTTHEYEMNLLNKNQGHTSDSSVQNLMYYQAKQPLSDRSMVEKQDIVNNNEKLPTALVPTVVGKDDPRLSSDSNTKIPNEYEMNLLNRNQGHTSDSSLQNLMYYQAKEPLSDRSTVEKQDIVNNNEPQPTAPMPSIAEEDDSTVAANLNTKIPNEYEMNLLNRNQGHTGDSSVQNLMYYQAKQPSSDRSMVEKQDIVNNNEPTALVPSGTVVISDDDGLVPGKPQQSGKSITEGSGDAFGSTKRNVDGKHISQNTVADLMNEQDGSSTQLCHRNRSITNTDLCSDPSSTSFLQPPKEVASLMSTAMGDLGAVIMKSHSSKHSIRQSERSTIQNLLYPAPIHQLKVIDLNDCGEMDFELKLPEHRAYTELDASLNMRFLHYDHEKEPMCLWKDDLTNLEANELIEDNSERVDLHSLPISLRNCVLRPIVSHSTLVNRCAITYFMTELKLLQHFKSLRRYLLLEDGEFAQILSEGLFDMVHSGMTPYEAFNPVALDSLLTRSIHACTTTSDHSHFTSNLRLVAASSLKPTFGSTVVNILEGVELRYHVEWPCNIILTESCHKKYNQVLSFLLQLKHVVWALHDIRTRLDDVANQRSVENRCSAAEARMLHIYRHEMHNFVKIMQGYVSTQVLYVCWEEFLESLRTNVKNVEDLHLRHAEYINKCLLRCLLTNKAQRVMSVIRNVLQKILHFRTQLSTPSSAIFNRLRCIYVEFTNSFNFLFRIVSKLVQRGYQPHLDDFLIRLNFNGFYTLQ